MRYSLNEIEALCKRAARGSGLSWGLSEEAARASRWLAAHSLPGPQMLAALLELNDQLLIRDVAPTSLNGIWSAPLGRMSPIIAGAALSDSATRIRAGEIIIMRNVTQPLLVVPFAGTAALCLDIHIMVEWGNVNVTTNGHTLSIEGDSKTLTSEHTDSLSCVAGRDIKDPMPSAHRGEINQSVLTCLSEFAGRTYAPATAESRESGAGAGLDGND